MPDPKLELSERQIHYLNNAIKELDRAVSCAEDCRYFIERAAKETHNEQTARRVGNHLGSTNSIKSDIEKLKKALTERIHGVQE